LSQMQAIVSKIVCTFIQLHSINVVDGKFYENSFNIISVSSYF